MQFERKVPRQLEVVTNFNSLVLDRSLRLPMEKKVKWLDISGQGFTPV